MLDVSWLLYSLLVTANQRGKHKHESFWFGVRLQDGPINIYLTFLTSGRRNQSVNLFCVSTILTLSEHDTALLVASLFFCSCAFFSYICMPFLSHSILSIMSIETTVKVYEKFISFTLSLQLCFHCFNK